MPRPRRPNPHRRQSRPHRHRRRHLRRSPRLHANHAATNHAAAVQTALNSHGAQLDVDGHMGPKTVAALKTFQKQHKLKVTGKLDHATAKALGV